MKTMPNTFQRYERPQKESPYAARELAHDAKPPWPQVYQYSPLVQENRQIRVLELRPGEWHDQIEGTIQPEVIGSDRAVNYGTVSYAWGSSTQRLSLMIDGCTLSVPANTVAALRRLRSQYRLRRIW